jgi:hypothetical protein
LSRGESAGVSGSQNKLPEPGTLQVASLRKERDLKEFIILIYIRLDLFRARIKVIAILNIEVDKNFISYRCQGARSGSTEKIGIDSELL